MQEIAAFYMESQGPIAMTVDQSAFLNGLYQQVFLGVPAIRIVGGINEIQRNIVGERILDLLTDMWVDKGISFKGIPTAQRS